MTYFLFFALLSGHAFAFINIESLRKNSKPGLNTGGNILFNQQSGNTNKVLSKKIQMMELFMYASPER